MKRATSKLALAALCLCCGIAGSAAAGLFDNWRACPPEDREARAGCPQCVAPWAKQGYDPTYAGYYVGGGTPGRGEWRYPHEGTWGVDYVPWYSRVSLNWSHRLYQGGEGQYEPNAKNRPYGLLYGR